MRAGRIESRRRVTDAAVIDAATGLAPRSVLDMGCGEGWLARTLVRRGIAVTGIDASPELVAAASAAGAGRFHCIAYEALAEGDRVPGAGGFDALICNFSLIGRAATATVLRAAPALLGPQGHVVIQTLHPAVACGDAPYRDGWREGSWAGCGPAFTVPAPWYFRTLEGWFRLFAEAGLRLEGLREPLHPDSGRPASILFTLAPRD